MARKQSPIARWLEPFAASLGILFGVWTALVAVVWCFGFGSVELQDLVQNRDLRTALQWLERVLDPAWLTLAAVNVYAALVESEKIDIARRWTSAVFAGALVLGWLSVATSFPLGPIHFTDVLGAKVGRVPLAMPLLWVVVILAARETALKLLPRASYSRVAVAAGVLAALTALNLEPHAWKLRSWWIWYPANLHAPSWPPLRDFVSWFAAAFAFAWLTRPEDVVESVKRRPLKPVAIFAALNGVFLAAHVARWLR